MDLEEEEDVQEDEVFPVVVLVEEGVEVTQVDPVVQEEAVEREVEEVEVVVLIVGQIER